MKRFSRVLLAACAVMSAVSVPLRAQSAGQGGVPSTTPMSSPWEQSLALEGQGHLLAARDVMRQTFGTRPALYDSCVRLAWLSLQLADYPEAIVLYRRARGLTGALPEATTGLTYALVGTGYAALHRGALADARRAFDEAQVLDQTLASAREGSRLVGSSSQLAPELWTGTINAARDNSAASIVYLHVPKQVSPEFGVRVALRSVNSATSTAGTTSFFGAQTEKFAGVVYDLGPATYQAMGFQLSSDVGSTTGAAVGLRAGGRTGLLLTATAMSRPNASNLQVAPMLFHWIGRSTYLAAGARATSDSSQTSLSALAEIAVRRGPALFDVRAHVGNERSAFDLAGPTILSFDAGTSAGAALTAEYTIAPAFQVFAQGHVERLISPSTNGSWYRSISLGLRLVLTNATH